MCEKVKEGARPGRDSRHVPTRHTHTRATLCVRPACAVTLVSHHRPSPRGGRASSHVCFSPSRRPLRAGAFATGGLHDPGPSVYPPHMRRASTQANRAIIPCTLQLHNLVTPDVASSACRSAVRERASCSHGPARATLAHTHTHTTHSSPSRARHAHLPYRRCVAARGQILLHTGLWPLCERGRAHMRWWCAHMVGGSCRPPAATQRSQRAARESSPEALRRHPLLRFSICRAGP